MMKYRFPDKVSVNRTSLIREVADRGKTIPGFISLALGSPAPECVPIELLRSCAAQVLEEDPMSVLQYGPLEGDVWLRDWVMKWMKERKGCAPEGNRVLMLTGSGKGLALIPRTLCQEGDEVYCDDITYPNAVNCMKFAGCRTVAIETDNEGMIPSSLEKAVQSGRGKWIYLIPNFQNPTGKTMSLQRRKEIYEVAVRNSLIIYEDDPYGDIRFTGEDIPTFKSFDQEGVVIYAGSFSKTLSAGLRVGYLYGSQELIGKIAAVKHADGQDPIYSQKIVSKALQQIDFDAHIKSLREVYARKCDLMARILEESCSGKCRILKPEGGMFLWIEIPKNVDIDVLCDAAIERGVGIVKSAAFAVEDDRTGHGIRLNFSAPSEENIRKGSQILGTVIAEYC